MAQKMAELRVDVPNTLEPTFANNIIINHKDDEFCLTFIQTIPHANVAKAKAIIAITPQHAKRLLNALQENIKKYEGRFGEIKLPEVPKEGAPTTYIG